MTPDKPSRPIVTGLTRAERKIYNALFESPAWFLSHRAMWAKLYTHPFDPESRTLAQLIKRLRRKLPEGVTIRTVYGEGYGLEQAPAVSEGK